MSLDHEPPQIKTSSILLTTSRSTKKEGHDVKCHITQAEQVLLRPKQCFSSIAHNNHPQPSPWMTTAILTPYWEEDGRYRCTTLYACRPHSHPVKSDTDAPTWEIIQYSQLQFFAAENSLNGQVSKQRGGSLSQCMPVNKEICASFH
jgi:hypothetical protein